MNAFLSTVDVFISTVGDTLLSVFAILWVPLCGAVFLFFVVYAVWPSNRKKFFPARPASGEGIRAGRSSNP
jgi:hypothetical protein